MGFVWDCPTGLICFNKPPQEVMPVAMFDVQNRSCCHWRPRHRSRVLVCMDVVLFFGSALVALKFWSLNMFGLVICHLWSDGRRLQWKVSNFKVQCTAMRKPKQYQHLGMQKGHGRRVFGVRIDTQLRIRDLRRASHDSNALVPWPGNGYDEMMLRLSV